MKRTRKWAFVAQEAGRLAALGKKPSEIARALGLDKSTVTRWISAGKLTRHEAQAPAARAVAEGAWRDKTAAEWAAIVREDYDLSETDDQMVTLAESALLLSRDPLALPGTRLAAMREFRAQVKQLGLETRAVVPMPDVAPAEPETSSKVAPALKRTGTDPRGILMGLK
jgi:hypothetical protein